MVAEVRPEKLRDLLKVTQLGVDGGARLPSRAAQLQARVLFTLSLDKGNQPDKDPEEGRSLRWSEKEARVQKLTRRVNGSGSWRTKTLNVTP